MLLQVPIAALIYFKDHFNNISLQLDDFDAVRLYIV